MSILKKFFNTFFKKKEEKKITSVQLGDQLKDADLDYKFAQLFTHSGGYFHYCGSDAEALKTLYQITQAEATKSVFCCDDDLKNFLNVLKIPHTESLELINDCAFISCEYLIAFDGRIMLSHNNIKHYPTSSLPDKIIIIANISQIVPNLNTAMEKVKRRGCLKNLTSISGNISNLDSPNANNNKLFLLLLED
ncbi:LUD domain-containing protein [Elizabethkingia sp. JS20170427COW]|uniref:LUD domain-containing protein n=1 Tax=Elizabethkingia sp. JS20170427COW TaxID=2583851 RepID=UPI0011109114|nr:LUD domain-containing protein [Elizabethkingia sp. JS20170427COW]QCX53024.1 hypothetical protein FGE20_04405 [Elizabethkingia sp. JS20170427COW]